MKLCFLTGEYPPMQGGVADHTAHLAHALSQMDCEVCILTSTRAAAAETGGPVRVFPIITNWGIGCWQQIELFLAAEQPDVLHIQYQAAAFDLAGWINWLPGWLRFLSSLRLAGRRPLLAVTYHDLRIPYLFPKAGRLRWRAVLALGKQADVIITTNAEDESVLDGYPWSKGRLYRIPLGSNVEMQPPEDYNRQVWRARLGVADDDFLLAYFGFLNDSKGGQELVLALQRLVEQGYPARLLMIGGQTGDVDPTNQAYANQVHAIIEQHDLAERVLWTGHVSPAEVSAHLLATDACVMLYRDGVSFRRTTLISALRHGCPTVTTAPAVPLPEVVDGGNMLLVPPQDVAAAAAAVARLIDDANLRQRLSKGAVTLGKSFDWGQIAARTRQAYGQHGV